MYEKFLRIFLNNISLISQIFIKFLQVSLIDFILFFIARYQS